MHSTNSRDLFIAVAPDSSAVCGVVPKETATPSVALRTLRMLQEAPYVHSSDDVIFTVWADRRAIPADAREAARADFFSKGQACLRASALGKRYGWGIHHDSDGRVAVYAVESPEYAAFVNGERLGRDGAPVTVKHAMRSRR